MDFLEKAAYISKSTVVNKLFADNENMKYSENSNTGILTMSANIDTRFYVQNTNYGKKDLAFLLPTAYR